MLRKEPNSEIFDSHFKGNVSVEAQLTNRVADEPRLRALHEVLSSQVVATRNIFGYYQPLLAIRSLRRVGRWTGARGERSYL
jgi:hypothetical protein